ncbi:hypothetical protein P170DRAFT_426656 [Aspergillus steynii IBT 23096]|uniref:Uncharacterized protein n=1 Tax=Aspergillus steynii IBT 23096 TaxID=1392250 RepID=A0A2I2GA86_9EURO|nr:uncharacterized protein P170DRAFT_426656 [Aspergillus steynii IBT 23096]PLB49790.1 hypothetical protein P170DRAFT_426656 [Aspergillus steynii IBT 23096]
MSRRFIQTTEYIKYVSVYTGPGLFANLRDEYDEARKRLMKSEHAKIINDEDITSETCYVREVQLHSHLLFKVVVLDKNPPRELILRAAANTAWGILYARTPQCYSGYKMLRFHPSKEFSKQLRGDMRRISRIDFSHHHLFQMHVKPVTELRPSEWTPADVDAQYERYPLSCAEDAKFKEERQKRCKMLGYDTITFSRNSKGDTEILVQRCYEVLQCQMGPEIKVCAVDFVSSMKVHALSAKSFSNFMRISHNPNKLCASSIVVSYRNCPRNTQRMIGY